VAPPNQILDALVLAALPEPAQIGRIAALWCREFNNRAPYNSTELDKWVSREFGPVLNQTKIARLSRDLLDETKRQSRLRLRRIDRALQIDPLTTPTGSDVRLGHLVKSRLGSAQRWTRRFKAKGETMYMDGGVHSGLVAGLVPLLMRLRRISNPNLLVYRYRWSEPCTRFVPNYITTVADAFIWLIPPDAAEFLRLPGSRVEHDGVAQTVRLVTQFGERTLPWRSLASD